MIHHFYHMYTDGGKQWERPLREHLAALDKSGLETHNTVVAVGKYRPSRYAAVDALGGRADDYVVFNDGYEQRTLDIIHDQVQSGKIAPGDRVLYAHTKGAGFYLAKVSDPWRKCMTDRLIVEASHCLDLLDEGHDTVGCHWLTPEHYPLAVTIPYYGGNFWWATAEHLAKLPPPSNATRYHAEAWLGTVRPENPADLQPGWPGTGCSSH